MSDEINVRIEETTIHVQVVTPGVSKFIELEDTPQTYKEGKFLKSTSSGIVFAVPQGGGDMLVSIYDANHNGIVDFSEGVRVLSSFPATAKQGDIVVIAGKVFINL